MFENSELKQILSKIAVLLLIGAVLLLTFSVLTAGKDGRRQISDDDGGSEERLCSILSGVKGAGDVEVMIRYDSDDNVSGVIVSAEGGGDPQVINTLTNGVAALFDIPVSNVMIFEKEQEE